MRRFFFITCVTIVTTVVLKVNLTDAAATAVNRQSAPLDDSALQSNSLTSSADDSLNVQLTLLKSVSTALLSDHKVQKRAWTHLKELLNQKIIPLIKSMLPKDFKLESINVSTSLKLIAFVLSSLFAMSSLIRPILPNIALTSSIEQMRSLTDGVDELTKLNYDLLSKSIDSIRSKNFLIEMKGPSCHERAICEVGEFVSIRYPRVYDWMQSTLTGTLEQFIIADQYIISMLKGLKQHNCTVSYNQCAKSPFHTWSEILSKFH